MLEEERCWLVRVASIIIVSLMLFSCASLTSVASIVGNAGVSSKGIKTTFSDSYVKSKILGKITLLDLKNFSNISVNVTRGTILLTGYVDSAEKRLLVVKEIWKVNGVQKIVNELKINENIPFSQRADDLIQKTKISSRLLFKDGINSNNYHVDVVNNEVYVMGLAENLNEKNEVENFLSSMPDIKNLITIIEIPKHTDR